MMKNTTPKTAKRRARLAPERQQEIAQRIRTIREAKTPRLGQGELAKRAGIDPATLNQIEQGKRAPDLASVLAIAEQLGVPTSAFLDAPAQAAGSDVRQETAALSATIQAATTASLADLVTTIIAALSTWHATHVFREDDRVATGTAGERAFSRDDRG